MQDSKAAITATGVAGDTRWEPTTDRLLTMMRVSSRVRAAHSPLPPFFPLPWSHATKVPFTRSTLANLFFFLTIGSCVGLGQSIGSEDLLESNHEGDRPSRSGQPSPGGH
jgi:hypothetical protein